VSRAINQIDVFLDPLNSRLAIWRLMCSLHKHGIQHNDVAPRNFVRDHDGRVRVVDFEMSELDHVCKGTKGCEELNHLWQDLCMERLDQD
jgi:tRNA A-37 threonylcarbamoyl transferase component Bud32